MKKFKTLVAVLALLSVNNLIFAQDHHHDVQLHINTRWEECSFQLDSSLTQKAYNQFTREAGLVAYFRPLTSAKPMGSGNFEVSILQWATAFDDTDPAWNDTFVHPDSAHWLKESERLKFPGITARVGITDKLDVAVYVTKSFGANYGFWGGQLQYNVVNNVEKKWAASARLSFTSMYGPEDLKLNIYGLDLLVSKEFKVYSDWFSVSPYVGVSTYLSNTREVTEKVTLHDEHLMGGQAMVGTVFNLSRARLGFEYNFAKVSTLSFKIGVAF